MDRISDIKKTMRKTSDSENFTEEIRQKFQHLTERLEIIKKIILFLYVLEKSQKTNTTETKKSQEDLPLSGKKS